MPFELVKLFSFKWENAQLNGFKQALRVTKSRTRLKQFSIHTHTQTKRKDYLIKKKKCNVGWLPLWFHYSSGMSVFPSFHSTVLSWSFGFASCGPTIVAMVVKITSTQSLRHAGRTASLGMLQSGFLLCPFDQSCMGIVGTKLAAGKEVIELLEPTFSPWTWEGAHFPCDPLILGQK